MHGFSTVDGFVEINQSLSEMIKYVANEPSVGLFFVQQHTQNAVPNVISNKNNILRKSHETNLHTEDLEDSITMVKSMKECGFPIIEDMIKDINKSLAIMSAKEAKRGLINNPNSRYQMGRTSSWGPTSWASRTTVDTERDGEKSGYLTNVLKSAKEKATAFKWTQMDSKDVEADEMSLSNDRVPEELQEIVVPKPLLEAEDYEDFRADREVKLNDWLEGNDGNLVKDAEQL